MTQVSLFSARLGIFNASFGQVTTQSTTTKKPVQKGRSRQQQQQQLHDENVSLLSQPSLNPLGICQIYTGTTCENYLKNQVSILPKNRIKNADTHNFLSIDPVCRGNVMKINVSLSMCVCAHVCLCTTHIYPCSYHCRVYSYHPTSPSKNSRNGSVTHGLSSGNHVT